MYKKIKNGSFMNWIWFFICIAPILLLIIYSIGFFNSKDLEINQNDKYTLELNSINGYTLKEETNIFQTLTLYDGTTGTYNDNGSITITQDNIFSPSYNKNLLSSELYFWLFSDTTNSNNYFTIRYQNFDGTYYDTQPYYYNDNNYYGFGILALYNTLNVDNKTLNSFDIYVHNDYNTNIYPIASRTNLYFNNNWFNNYKNYVNDFNTIKYNSCPISYTYNNLTYNIETNSNNYLGTNENIEINQNFNYSQDEEINLNYNNYFPSNVNITSNETYVYGANIGNNLTEQGNLIHPSNLEYNENYTYYTYANQTYVIYANVNSSNYDRLKDRLYVNKETIITYTYNIEYYNIESTTNTSLTLIPNNTYQDYLNNINDTLKTNGFIANTFLNLSTYFNVSNVYYSLRAYYVEYLLIMILLHLAFDILYILPNICHKFMEKIGGERD